MLSYIILWYLICSTLSYIILYDICRQLHNSNIDIAGGGVNSWQGGCNNGAK